MTEPVQFRKLVSHEASLHREIRLRALNDSPDSFGETFSDAEVQPVTYWENLTRSVTSPNHQVMFLACQDEKVIGSVYGLLDRERSDTGRVGGMWVSPEWRRRGIGSILLAELVTWARERKLKRLALWVPLHSSAAVEFYTKAGFQCTGERKQLASKPSLSIGAMEIDL